MGELRIIPNSPTPSESYYEGMGGSPGAGPNRGTGRGPLSLITNGTAVSYDRYNLSITVDKSDENGSAKPSVQEKWLPLTSSRNGNTLCAVFHILSSGIGNQALMLPLAFSALGWSMGIICLSIAFAWQLYTAWLLVQLHESPSGTRNSRFLTLAFTAFGERITKWAVMFPVLYLSSGTCINLILFGGKMTQRFFEIVCDGGGADRLNGVEWLLVFTCIAFILAQLPHLNSVSTVSLVGAVSGVAYCTMIWAVSVREGRPTALSDHYQPKGQQSHIERARDILNALGIVALSFRGHNLILEIQGTLPSDLNCPTRRSMWIAVVISCILIAMCLYPVAIVGYWAYGDMIFIRHTPTSSEMLILFTESYGKNVSKSTMAITFLLIAINSLASFQGYAMVVFDNFEFKYVSRKNRPCPRWLRPLLRLLYLALAFLLAVAFPFLGRLGPILGGLSLTVTFVYPCFMWIAIEKPRRNGAMWRINVGLGCLGTVLCVEVFGAAIWNLVAKGLHANFFHP